MKFSPLCRLIRIPVAVAVTTAAVSFTYPGGLFAAVEDFQNYSRFSREIDAERDRDAQLSNHSMGLYDRIAAKQSVIDEVLDGRVSLTEAAERFLSLTAGDVQAMELLRARYDGSTDLERVACNVIEHAKAQHEHPNSAAVVVRLDGQFRARFGHPR